MENIKNITRFLAMAFSMLIFATGCEIQEDFDYKPSAKPKQSTSEDSSGTSGKAYIPAGEESFEEIKNSQMRKTIAKRLSESKFNAPHYYLTIEINMANAMLSRKQINDIPDTKVSYNDMVIKAVAAALRQHPKVYVSWRGDTMRFNQHINIG